MTDELKEAALAYAAQGRAVFPVEAGGKRPVTASGFKDASTDAETVARMWDAAPDCNIGMAVPADVLIIDVDPRNRGDHTMTKLLTEHGMFPRTLTVDTPSGGYHLYFSVPEGVLFKSVLGPGVDLKRAGKGYVLVPPSRTEHGEYKTREDWLAIAPLPDWVREGWERVEQPLEAAAEAVPTKPMMPFEDGTPYGVAAMERELGKLMAQEEGGRNEALNRAAFALGQLVAGGELRAEQVGEALTQAATRMGLNRVEAAGTIRSGFDAGLLRPRSAPEIAPRGQIASGGTEAILDELREQDPEQDGPFWVDWTQDLPPAAFWAYPVIPKQAYVLVYGPTQASKSMVWQGLGAEASRRGVKVSYYSLENPVTIDVDRMRRLRPDPQHFRLTNHPLDFSHPEQVAEFIGREQGQDVVIIDTYSHAFGGDFGGDHNAKAIEFAKVIRLAMRKTGATFVVLDHTGFATRDDPRDSSAKRQQVDVAYLMQPEGVWVKGKPARFIMENKKSARFANPFEYQGEIVDGGKLDNDEHGRSTLDIRWKPGSTIEWTVP